MPLPHLCGRPARPHHHAAGAGLLGGANGYWSVLFHELIHWVVLGRNRLCWDGTYSQGELIAEMGATILTNRCGIPMSHDLAGNGEHVEAWVNGIREDLGYLTHASAVAEVASSHVLNPSRWEMPA